MTELLTARHPSREYRNDTEQKGCTSEPSSTKRLPSRARLLVFATLLPAAVAVTNQLLLEFASPASLRIWFYPWMAVSAAVLSWTVGRYLSPAWLRWIVFVWCLALLDLLTIAACLGGGPIEFHFAFVLVSAQITLLVVWAILSPMPWQWSLSGLLVATPFVIQFAGSFGGYWGEPSWNALMFLTTVVSVLLSSIVLGLGFKLQKLSVVELTPSDHLGIGAHQFGLKHMLLWAAAMVPMLLVARGLDFFILKSLGRPMIFPLALLAFAVATTNLAAIWSVLGRGSWTMRLFALFVIPFVLAIATIQVMDYLNAAYKYRPFPNPWWGSLAYDIYRTRDTWRTWLWLDAALLAALLLFVRASGYRLVRKGI